MALTPYGGEPRRGFDSSEEALELVQSFMSGDLAVLVVIERQHGVVGGLPDQDWSLRVTLVFRREGSEWRLAHRHADALVHPVSAQLLATLARGEALSSRDQGEVDPVWTLLAIRGWSVSCGNLARTAVAGLIGEQVGGGDGSLRSGGP